MGQKLEPSSPRAQPEFSARSMRRVRLEGVVKIRATPDISATSVSGLRRRGWPFEAEEKRLALKSLRSSELAARARISRGAHTFRLAPELLPRTCLHTVFRAFCKAEIYSPSCPSLRQVLM
jgi:hypothetical protein